MSRQTGHCRRFTFSLTTIVLCLDCLFGLVSSLDCHCLNGNLGCDQSNGFCPSGCEKGWFGPGCQVGNLALGKTARQSTTGTDTGFDSSALKATDGLMPALGSDTVQYCSQTAAGQSLDAWWYVTLSESDVFVLMNITLVNRQGLTANRLGYFYILYTNDTSSSSPSPENWATFAYERDTLEGSTQKSYTNKSLAIGRRVAVYISSQRPVDTENILTLCEVYVYGYRSLECRAGYTGPGCLLYGYDSAICRTTLNTALGDFGGCNFLVCPENANLPPDCWITMPSFKNVTWNAEASCDYIHVTTQSLLSIGNRNATSIFISISPNGSSENIKGQCFGYESFKNLDIIIPVPLYQAYYAWLTPLICPTSIGGYNESTGKCVNIASCQVGVSSPAKVVRTNSSRSYSIRSNGSCIFSTIYLPSRSCGAPVSLSLLCSNASTEVPPSITTGAVLCGLSAGRNYSCTVVAKLQNNLTETFTTEVYMPDESETTGTSTTISMNNSVTATLASGVSSTLDHLNTSTPSGQTAIIAGSLAGFLSLAAITMGLVIYSLRKRKRNQKCGGVGLINTALSNSAYEPMEVEKTYWNVGGMTLTEFVNYVRDEFLINRRFDELNDNQNHPCLCGKDPQYKGKNRFQNILPYDANRVILASNTGSYINASYMDGYVKPKKYIATQGPLKKTIDDFWHMVWQENVTTIVMLTDYIEQSKKKCEKYFPKLPSDECAISVALQSTEIFDTHTISTISVQNAEETRIVKHYHLTAWRDQSVPDHCAQVVLFYCKIPALLDEQQPESGPVIVHCSAGVGRTGAFLAFDYLQQRFMKEARVDVDYCVLKLRDQRMFMVQTKEQYVFLHNAALYAMKTLSRIFDATRLASFVKEITDLNESENPLIREWKLLQECAITVSNDDFVTARHEENAPKNRTQQVLARDSQRPILSEKLGSAGDYINAVYCNGCYADRGFIATQLPLAETVNDFWRMVYECRVSCIVLLHDLVPNEDCPQYWPGNKETMAADTMAVTNVSHEKSQHDRAFRVLELTLASSLKSSQTADDPRPVKLFILNSWDWNADIPKNAKNMLSLAKEVTSFCKSSQNQPVVVQCRDGASHSGLFVAAVNSLHRLIETSQVQVFHSVDLARASRQEFVKNQDQYRFIYEFLHFYHQR